MLYLRHTYSTKKTKPISKINDWARPFKPKIAEGKRMNKKEQELLFQKLYEQTYTGLRRFVQCRSRNLHMIDDILQEIYLETLRHINDLAVHENQVGWSYNVIVFILCLRNNY